MCGGVVFAAERVRAGARNIREFRRAHVLAASRSNDWVLVLDDASKKFARPGATATR